MPSLLGSATRATRQCGSSRFRCRPATKQLASCDGPPGSWVGTWDPIAQIQGRKPFNRATNVSRLLVSSAVAATLPAAQAISEPGGRQLDSRPRFFGIQRLSGARSVARGHFIGGKWAAIRRSRGQHRSSREHHPIVISLTVRCRRMRIHAPIRFRWERPT